MTLKIGGKDLACVRKRVTKVHTKDLTSINTYWIHDTLGVVKVESRGAASKTGWQLVRDGVKHKVGEQEHMVLTEEGELVAEEVA